MLILAQGLVGLGDAFMHPHYISSSSPLAFGSLGCVALLLVLGIIVIAGAIILYLHLMRRRNAREQYRSVYDDDGPP